MDRVLADKFSYVVKEIWRIRTEIDRLAHSVIELTAMTAERMEETDNERREEKREEDKMGRQDS